MGNDGPEKPPSQATAGDIALVAAKAAVSAVPVVGGPVAELLDLVRTPLQRRQDEWLAGLAERLARLVEEGRVTREKLADDQDFLDAIARGVQAAIRTGQSEKREALRNAALNVALNTTPDEAERALFQEMVERFTPWHLRLLKAFHDPEAWARDHALPYAPAITSSLGGFLEAAFPELRGRSGFYDRVWSDLLQARLVNAQLAGNLSADGWRARRTSLLGDRFLDFIAEPAPL